MPSGAAGRTLRTPGRWSALKALKESTRGAARRAWRMGGEDLDRMFTLAREVGRVELKFTVAEPSYDAVRTALGAGTEKIRSVYFLDTQDLALRRRGVLARVRGGQRPNDSVVKLRPIVPDGVPRALRRCPDFTVEVDLTPDSFVCSGALKRRLARHAVERAVDGGSGLRTLFSAQQLTLLAGRMPGDVVVDDLLPLGPVEVHRTRPRRDGPSRGLELQEWMFPDGTRLLEVSTRCTAEQLLPTAAHATAFLDRHGVARSSGPCPTKADATLAYFTRQ